nr:hypothetical protein [Bacteroidota bacterium]
MKPFVHNKKIYFPMRTIIDRLKPGDLFIKTTGYQSIFTFISGAQRGYSARNKSGDIYYFSFNYDVYQLM